VYSPLRTSTKSSTRLNAEQQAALRYIDGPLLVLAGAGSGKTSVITEKVAYLIKNCYIKPQYIFAVTFTNKAAREMKERVGKLISNEQKSLLNVSTFHTLGLNIIREEIYPAYMEDPNYLKKKNFKVYLRNKVVDLDKVDLHKFLLFSIYISLPVGMISFITYQKHRIFYLGL